MGNYSSTEIEVFKGIVSVVENDAHALENQTSYDHVDVWERLNETTNLNETLQEPDLSTLKFLHNYSDTSTENTVEASSSKPEASKSPEASSSFPGPSGPSVSSLISLLTSSEASSTRPKPRPPLDGPPTVQRLSSELQDVREELEQLRTQQKKEIKLLMNELDEEKKQRLSLQVEVERLKKRLSKS